MPVALLAGVMSRQHAAPFLAVQAVDDLIGKVQAALVASGHDKDTYVFFSSDNGYHTGEHSLLPGKQTAYDTDIHLPLIVTGPRVPAGVSAAQILAPRILDAGPGNEGTSRPVSSADPARDLEGPWDRWHARGRASVLDHGT